MITVVLGGGVGLSALACLLVAIADRPWRGRHTDHPDDLPTLLPPRVVARRAGEDDRAARLAAPDTVPTTIPDDADTALIPRVVDTAELPPLVVSSPPSMRGTRPTVLGVPVVRLPSCSWCRDGEAVIGDRCAACGIPHPAVRS
jgi:hypothetical protein